MGPDRSCRRDALARAGRGRIRLSACLRRLGAARARRHRPGAGGACRSKLTRGVRNFPVAAARPSEAKRGATRLDGRSEMAARLCAAGKTRLLVRPADAVVASRCAGRARARFSQHANHHRAHRPAGRPQRGGPRRLARGAGSWRRRSRMSRSRFPGSGGRACRGRLRPTARSSATRSTSSGPSAACSPATSRSTAWPARSR